MASRGFAGGFDGGVGAAGDAGEFDCARGGSADEHAATRRRASERKRTGPSCAPYLNEAGRWVTLGTYGDETEARIEPFEAVPLDVASWWPPAPEG